jgi:NADH-quinone oxidoreductase subunit M
MGVDGISLWLVLLTTFLTPLCVLISWKSVHERVKEFFILLLILETALIGVFTSLDLFLFYFFWEATLIPMALLIGVFGHERKVYAAVKFFMYTMIASVFMLAAILWLYAQTGSFDFIVIREKIMSGAVPGFASAAQWLFLGFFLAFAVKVPLFPFHTWLPDAHVEAPTAGSVLLAGVLLKMGTYGMLRFNLGRDGSTEPEEVDRVFFGEPSGLCGAGDFQLHAGGVEWCVVRHAGAWNFHGRIIHAGRDTS